MYRHGIRGLELNILGRLRTAFLAMISNIPWLCEHVLHSILRDSTLQNGDDDSIFTWACSKV